MPDRLPQVLDGPGQSKSFQDQKAAVKEAPDHEVPTGAVPQAAQKKHDHEIAIRSRRRAAVAAERYVEVVAEPGRQRNVPAPPEVLHRFGNVGPPEILWES